MILKDKTIKPLKAATTKAGQQQEKDVAFYLRRAFKDNDKVFVINDFKFTYNDETAQIDHLIVYRFGFILIESKSITGNVRVNKQEEWSRSYRGKWQGMASPIKQAELQQKLLKDLLYENRKELVGKILGMQQAFGGRSWHQLCAISSNAIVERENMPEGISKRLVKSEFLADAIFKLMDLKSDIVRTLSLTDNRPAFNVSELNTICEFLMIRCEVKPKVTESTVKQYDIDEKATIQIPEQNIPPQLNKTLLACKNCNEQMLLTPLSGKYGYYVKCGACEANTPLKIPCTGCNSKKTKVSKKKEVYTLNCLDCLQYVQLLPIN